MKILLKLLISIFLAGCFCILLIAVGVLSLENDGTVEDLKAKTVPVYRKIVDSLDHRITGNEKPIPDQKRSEAVLPDRQIESNPVIENDSENRIYNQILTFMRNATVHGRSDVEDRLAAYLVHELRVDSDEVETWMRMSFWKNFVTLQRKWKPEDIEKMQQAFDQEKTLKQAGFAAKGLMLMSGTIRDAENLLLTLKNRMDSVARKGDST